MLTLWHRVRDGTLTHPAFQTAMQPIRHEVESLLQVATILVPHQQTQATCRSLLKHKTVLWTFVDHEGVEPTNNAAEQALRRGVLWRKRSFGTQSAAGSRFVERVNMRGAVWNTGHTKPARLHRSKAVRLENRPQPFKKTAPEQGCRC
ncbi:MAG: transposase [Ardenticatenaceae bacterium]|nr:transposase [Ardenticatenaceae bacterium]